MKTFSDLLEMWEHPFTGKDHIDDSEESMHTKYEIGNFSKMNPQVTERSLALRDHYAAVNKEHNYYLNQYQDGSSSINRMAIDMHKYGDKHDPGLSAYTSFVLPQHMARHVKNWLSEEPDVKDEYNANGNQRITTISHLDDAVKHTKTPHDMHVYSGVGFHPLRLTEHAGKKTFGLHLPAFRPSVAIRFARPEHAIRHTTDGRLAKIPEFSDNTALAKSPKNFAAHVLKIHVPEGSHGVYLGHRNDLSLSKREAEFIIPRKAKLIIAGKSSHTHDVYEDEYDKKLEKRVHVWHAKLVHDGVEPTRHMEDFK
jgi:hypothetical protein